MMSTTKRPHPPASPVTCVLIFCSDLSNPLPIINRRSTRAALLRRVLEIGEERHVGLLYESSGSRQKLKNRSGLAHMIRKRIRQSGCC
jgi:hypothetical protein